jgi:hypothetical protein
VNVQPLYSVVRMTALVYLSAAQAFETAGRVTVKPIVAVVSLSCART